MYKVKLTAKAERELKRLSKEERFSIGEIIEELKENPLSGKKLGRELSKKFSYRIGIYRIIYKVNQKDKVVEVLSAGHRGSVYN